MALAHRPRGAVWVLGAFFAFGCPAGGETDTASPTGTASLGGSTGNSGQETSTSGPSSAGVTSSVPTSDSDPTNPSDPTVAPTGGDCEGCLNEAGICESGEFDQSCGRGGSECVVCEAPAQCAEGLCEEPPSCGPDNCAGCCNGNDCVDAPTNASCGAGGSECTACNSEATCVDGDCELPCEDSCFGCCTPLGECIDDGDANDQSCGLFGLQCETCTGDQFCDFGICSSPSCLETCDGCCIGDTCFDGYGVEACGYQETCEVCSEGETCDSVDCVLDPFVQWMVVLLDGDIALLDAEGAAWDAFGGAPDPYLEITELGFTSMYVNNTFSPAWNETATASALTTDLWEPMTFIMRDSDNVVDDVIGECTVEIPDEAFGALHEVVCEVDGSFAWSAVLSIQPVQK